MFKSALILCLDSNKYNEKKLYEYEFIKCIKYVNFN